MRKIWAAVIICMAMVVMAWSAVAEQTMSTDVDPSLRARSEIDRKLFRDRLIKGSFAKWIKAAPTSNGYFKSAMDRRWKAKSKQKSHLVTQTRLLYVMAQAYKQTGDSKYRKALKKGADFLLRYYATSRDGTWNWQVSSKGKVIKKKKRKQTAYGQAFVMFGLAHTYRVIRDKRYLNAALDTWDNAEALKVIRSSRVPFKGYSQNPLMHTFEALLALHDATRIKALLDDAEDLADFVLDKLYQKKGAYIPEEFESKWRPRKGGHVEIGHQFEWAYLLSWGVQKGLPKRYLKIGKKLLDAAMKRGYDKRRGGIFFEHDYKGRVSGGKISWAQNELIRALMRYASKHGRKDLWKPFRQSLDYVEDYFVDDVHGGWFRRPVARSTSKKDNRPEKGTEWKVDYHVTGMYVEGLNLAR